MQELSNNNFIQFSNITPETLEQDVIQKLNAAKDTVKNITSLSDGKWNNVFFPLYDCLYNLNTQWNVVNHLLSVNDTPEIRKVYDSLQPLITDFYVNLGQNKNLYNQYKQIVATEYDMLDPQQQTVLDNEIEDFYLSGVDLDTSLQYQFKQIQNQLVQASTKFEQNLLDATDKFEKFVTPEELSGIPDDLVATYAKQIVDGIATGKLKLTLQAPSYMPVMQYCDNRTLRQELYYQFVSRASELGESTLDNTEIIKQIIKLRYQKAALLGFENYANLSLHTKMAEHPEEILNFLNQLVDKSKPQAQSELKELEEFAKTTSGIDKLEAWDIPYFSEKLQQQKYSYSTNELKQYFQLPVVLTGLFQLIKQLYDIEFVVNNDIPTWHPQVISYTITRGQQIIGYVCLDLYARSGKQSGAWMNGARDRYNNGVHNYLPVAYIICNFTNPSGDAPSLVTFDEVQTVFHEMGHALHHALTENTYFSIAGINGVEWDAVELPSQFMEYFAWDYNIIKLISKHITTGAVLPEELYQRVLNARFFQTGLHMLRQLEFAIFDIELHTAANNDNIDYLSLLEQVRQRVAVILPPNFNRFPNSFSHIFAGGYASGYYSYKWAEVLAADIFSLFENKSAEEYGVLGKRFYDAILKQGGLYPMLDNFKKFMGRKPQIDALLKYSGIANS